MKPYIQKIEIEALMISTFEITEQVSTDFNSLTVVLLLAFTNM